jgi:hypothetical protein
MLPKLYTLAEISDLLRYTGRDRERSVRRLFNRYKVPVLRRDRSTFLVTQDQYDSLLEAMRCSPCGSEAGSTMSVGRCGSVAKPAGSKSTLRAAIAAKMQKPTGPGSSTTFDKPCCAATAAKPKG